MQSGCILLSLSLKRHCKQSCPVTAIRLSSSALHNNSGRQNEPDKAAAKLVPNGKSARHPGNGGISKGYTANAQQRISIMQSGKGIYPLHAGLSSCAPQNSPLPGEKGISALLRSTSPNISQHPLVSEKSSEPASYKSAPLSQEPGSSRQKRSIHIFPQKPKNLERRCYRCLSYSYFIAICRDPVICWFCRANGNIKKNCPLHPKNQVQALCSKATPMEPIVLDHPTSLDIHYPPARDLNSLVSMISIEPATPTIVPWQ